MTDPPPPPSGPWAPPPPTGAPQFAPRAGRTSGLAIASLALGIMGFTVVPIIGAIAAAAIAPFAFRQIRAANPPLNGHGYAVAGFALGMLFGYLPALMISYAQRQEWGPAPLCLAAVLTAIVAVLSLREMRAKDAALAGGVVAGGLAMLLVAVLVAIGVAFAFAAAAGEAAEAVGDSLSDSFDCSPDIDIDLG